MQKKVKNSSIAAISRRRATTLVVCGCLVVCALASPLVRADGFDDQINALKQQNNQTQQSLNVLGAQAASYQDAISQLQNQINDLQNQISANEAKQADLQTQIAQKQAEIDHERKVLASDLKAMYVDDQMSTIEMLATSKNLSDYVDKEEYRGKVQAQIQKTMAEITTLQHQLQAQKAEIDKLLTDEKSQQTELDSAKSQQASLLAFNQSQQSQYSAQLKANSSKISQLRAAQVAENAKLYGNGSYLVAGNNGNDTYPNKWRNITQDSTIDNWGMYNRECVSYTAWKVYESGRHMPYWGGRGNANEWDEDARSANPAIPVSTTPQVGDVAIKNAGAFGHAMYVEHVYSDGAIYVSQYNQDYSGHYSEAYISAASVGANNLQFIHF